MPNFSNYVAGWITHPYGTGWRRTLEELISQTASHGAPSTIPIDITEWGLASDGGNCLTANYGWNPCMSYQEAAEILRKTFAEMRQMLGSRLGMFMLYQVRDQAASATSTTARPTSACCSTNCGRRGNTPRLLRKSWPPDPDWQPDRLT